MKRPAPTHATTAGRTYLQLRTKAREQGRGTEELLQLHALESFVDHLSTAAHRQELVLKGGVLLSAYDVRRPTRDVDLTAHGISNDPEHIRQWVAEVLAQRREDGWHHRVVSAEPIRESEAYSGVRVTVHSELATARVTFHVDVNVGDPVWPPARDIDLPRLLGGEIRVLGYPLAMILAEKIVTMMQRGTTNTRWRDFADVYLLTDKHLVLSQELRESVRLVAQSRRAELKALATVLDGFAALAQPRWAAWVRKQELVDRLPTAFDIVVSAVAAFAAPLTTSSDQALRWVPQQRAWMETD